MCVGCVITYPATLAVQAMTFSEYIFKQQSVPEILADVIKAQGISDVESNLQLDHRPREYCVQAGETDLDFIHRLAAEEGILYTFEHRSDGHTLVLTDQIDGLGTIGTHAACGVLYQPAGGGDSPEPALHRFHYTEQVRTARQVQGDYTFTHPRYNLQHAVAGRQLDNQRDDYERYDYPGRYKRDAAGKPFTKTRLSALRSDARSAHIEGDDARLQPGLAFDLNEHPREDLNSRWRTVAIQHTGKQHSSQQEEASGGEAGTSYHLKATAVHWQVDWKAPLQPKPRIDGPQIATVVGPPGEEIYCDEWGRVKVSFPWDRYSQANEHSSCWVRVAQGWAGTMWGAMAIPRIGQELIISYLDGDVDQPIATGRAYRADNLPPYELPRHKTRMTLKSQTHKGKGFNELRFEDERGKEEVFVHAQKDHNTHVNHDQGLFVGNDRTRKVEADEHVTIGKDYQRIVRGNSHSQIDGEQQHAVKGPRTTTVDADDKLNVGGDSTLKVGANLGLGAGRQIHLQAGDEIVLAAGASLTLQAGGHCLRLDPGGIHSSVEIDVGASPGPIKVLGVAAMAALSLEDYLEAAKQSAAATTNSCLAASGQCLFLELAQDPLLAASLYADQQAPGWAVESLFRSTHLPHLAGVGPHLVALLCDSAALGAIVERLPKERLGIVVQPRAEVPWATVVEHCRKHLWIKDAHGCPSVLRWFDPHGLRALLTGLGAAHREALLSPFSSVIWHAGHAWYQWSADAGALRSQHPEEVFQLDDACLERLTVERLWDRAMALSQNYARHLNADADVAVVSVFNVLAAARAFGVTCTQDQERWLRLHLQGGGEFWAEPSGNALLLSDELSYGAKLLALESRYFKGTTP
ncbi:unnamed protein product, partial [Mesorhabditis spiculigera]